jgi:hypothetical protein
MKGQFKKLTKALTAEDAEDAEERQELFQIRDVDFHDRQQPKFFIVPICSSSASSAFSAVRACEVSL